MIKLEFRNVDFSEGGIPESQENPEKNSGSKETQQQTQLKYELIKHNKIIVLYCSRRTIILW
jgi:hypothetical protein